MLVAVPGGYIQDLKSHIATMFDKKAASATSSWKKPTKAPFKGKTWLSKHGGELLRKTTADRQGKAKVADSLF